MISLGLFLGLWGIRWGLPGRERLARVMPPGLDGPEFLQRLADSWSQMHKELGEDLLANPNSFNGVLGVVDVPAGWKTPPPPLLASYRSFYVRSENEDEQSVLLMLSRMKPHKLQMNPHVFTYSTTHLYTVGAALALGAATRLVTLKSSILVYLDDPAKMAGMYLAGRLVSVASFIVTALLLLRLGRKYAGAEAGLLAGAMYLMLPAAVIPAHVLKNHAFWPIFILLTLEFCAAVLERGRPKDYAAAGAVSGLAVAAFLGAWPACLLVAAAGALRLADGKKPVPELRGLVLAGMCAVGAFLLVSPYWLVDWNEAMLEMKLLKGLNGGFDFSHPFVFAGGALRRAVTDPVATLMFGGTILALLRGKREPFLRLCAIAFLIGLASMATVAFVTGTGQARYFLGWIAVGCLLAGRLLQGLLVLKNPTGRFGTAAAGIVMAGLLCQALTYARNFRLGEGATSSHFLSGEWIEKNIPAGATIGLMRFPQPSNAPFFRYDRYRLLFAEPPAFVKLPANSLPAYLALNIPDYDDRVPLGAALDRYELIATFPRPRLFSWVEIDATSTTANPLIEIYRLKGKA